MALYGCRYIAGLSHSSVHADRPLMSQTCKCFTVVNNSEHTNEYILQNEEKHEPQFSDVVFHSQRLQGRCSLPCVLCIFTFWCAAVTNNLIEAGPLSLVLLERFISLRRQLHIVYLAVQVEMDNFQPFSVSKWFYCCHPVAQTMDFLPFLRRVNTSPILRGRYYSLLYFFIMKTR